LGQDITTAVISLNAAIGDITQIIEDIDETDSYNYLGKIDSNNVTGSLSDNNLSSLSQKIQYLIDNLLGRKSSISYKDVYDDNGEVTDNTEPINDIDRKMSVTQMISYLNTDVIGDKDNWSTSNNLKSAESLVSNLLTLDKALGNISDDKQYTEISSLHNRVQKDEQYAGLIGAINYITE